MICNIFAHGFLLFPLKMIAMIIAVNCTWSGNPVSTKHVYSTSMLFRMWCFRCYPCLCFGSHSCKLHFYPLPHANYFLLSAHAGPADCDGVRRWHAVGVFSLSLSLCICTYRERNELFLILLVRGTQLSTMKCTSLSKEAPNSVWHSSGMPAKPARRISISRNRLSLQTIFRNKDHIWPQYVRYIIFICQYKCATTHKYRMRCRMSTCIYIYIYIFIYIYMYSNQYKQSHQIQQCNHIHTYVYDTYNDIYIYICIICLYIYIYI